MPANAPNAMPRNPCTGTKRLKCRAAAIRTPQAAIRRIGTCETAEEKVLTNRGSWKAAAIPGRATHAQQAPVRPNRLTRKTLTARLTHIATIDRRADWL